MSPPTKTIAARVPAEIHKQVRLWALQHGLTVEDVVHAAVLDRIRGDEAANGRSNVLVTTSEPAGHTGSTLPETLVHDLQIIRDRDTDAFRAIEYLASAVAHGGSAPQPQRGQCLTAGSPDDQT